MLSTPAMKPFATEGAAPITITNRIACSSSPKSTIAGGNHAIDGMVMSPVTIDPTPARRTFTTSVPMSVPITTAMPSTMA